MKRDSLNTLRAKKWFQYLKYFYLGSFVISFLFVVTDSISILRPKLNMQQSKVVCDNGTNYSLADYGMHYENSHLASSDDRIAKRLCISDESVGELARASVAGTKDAELSNVELGKKVKMGGSFSYQNIYLMMTPEDQNYKVEAAYTRPGILGTILWLTIPVLILVGIFELELRIFYYITLGKFLPERPARYLFFKMQY